MSYGNMNTRQRRPRPRKFNNGLLLAVYTEAQLLALADSDNITQEAVPQVETGVEKEEEQEHDLQAAISAAQAAVTTGSSIQTYIPTPDASNVIDQSEFSKLYKNKYKESSRLIKFSSTVEQVTGCPYVMDDDDDAYLKKHHSALSLSDDEFEQLMWEFESITNRHLPHLYLDASHIPEYEDFLLLVPEHSIIHSWTSAPQLYTHWKDRRLKRGGKSIIPVLAFEDILKHEIDPYVCFRRREIKHVRKTRRTDQQSTDRLRSLRIDLEQARNLLEMVLRREKLRKEGLGLAHNVFDKTCRALECQRVLTIKDDPELNQILSPKTKRKSATGNGSGLGTTIKIPLSRLRRDAGDKPEKSPLQIQMEKDLSRRREREAAYEDITECPYQPLPKSLPNLFFQKVPSSSPSNASHVNPDQTPPTSSSTTLSRFRRRMGRGGRLFMDRVGFRPSKSSTPPSPTVGGKTKKRPSYLQMDSENEDSDYECDPMDIAALRYRATIMDEQAHRSLVTYPFIQPLLSNAMAHNARNGQQQKQQDQPQQSQRAALQNSSNTNSSTSSAVHSTTSTSSSPLVSSSSSPTPLKQQNSINSQMMPQQVTTAVTGQVVPNDTYTSNDVDTNENRPTMPSPHPNGHSLQRPTAPVS